MKDVNVLLQDAKDVLDDLNIPYGKIMGPYINDRAKSRWGQCRYIGNGWYRIEISSELLEDDVEWEAAMNTMIHELLHAHKDRMCHTGEWKRCAELVNRNYPIYNIKRTASAEERGVTIATEYNYVIFCRTCGAKSKYIRQTKAVKMIMKYRGNSGYRCSKCYSTNLTAEEI